jgi:hypothetical protein
MITTWLVRAVAIFFLCVAVALAVILFLKTRKLEAMASVVVLVATAIGTLVDKWVARRERRRELLRGLDHELYMNHNVLGDEKFKDTTAAAATPVVYPRLYVGALHAVIGAGAFTERGDRQLSILLTEWLQRSGEFNDRLLITETRTFVNPDPAEVATWRRDLVGGAVLRTTKASLDELSAHLFDHYATETDIGRDTVLFARDGK